MTSVAEVDALIAGLKGVAEDHGQLSPEVIETLSDIDDELMKRGTLSAANIDADKIITSCVFVLKTCTHLAAVRGLVLILPTRDQDPGLTTACTLARAVFADHWPDLHPKGDKFLRRRTAWATDIIGSLEHSLRTLLQQNRSISEPCRLAAENLVAAVKTAGLDADKIAQLLSRTDPPAAKPKPDASDIPKTPTRLDAKGRADLRRDIRALTDRIRSHDPKQPIAYSLRGFAAWLDYQYLPDANENGMTQLQAMPAFVVDEHRLNSESPTEQGLYKLEDRLFMNPDWFTGQLLAFTMAKAMGWSDVAAAILTRCKNRLADFPELADLQYTNGQTFVDEDAARWLKGASEAAPEKTAPAEAPRDLVSQLAVLEDALSKTKSPRSRAILKLDLAKAMRQSGLKAHANALLAELKAHMIAENVAEWDSELFAKVTKSL